MQDKEVDCATIAVANSTGISGTATADEIRLRIGKGRIVGNIVRYCMVGMAIALLPLRQAIAGDNDNRAIFPIGFLDVSTIPPVPASQDKNPYGVAFVPPGFPQGGKLNPGDALVSNFNDPANTQATVSTIIKVAPDGQTSLFFQGTPSAVTPSFGLTTALGVLKRGFVLVGNAPLASNGIPYIHVAVAIHCDYSGYTPFRARLGSSLAFTDLPAGLTGWSDCTHFTRGTSDRGKAWSLGDPAIS